MNPVTQMLHFLELLKSSEGERRQQLAQANKPLLRTELAQATAQQATKLHKNRVRRLELALKLVREAQQRETTDDQGES